MINKMINIDYSQVEARVIALITKKPKDIHSELAKELFGENFTKEQRQKAKQINYHKMYNY